MQEEPRYIVRAVSPPGQDIENKDFEILVQIGDKTYDLGPNILKLEIKAAEKITMFVELDVSEIQIDAPVTLIDKDGNKTVSRVKLSGSESTSALHSANIDCEVVDQKDVYIKDLTLVADGHTRGNNAEAHTVKKPA